MKKPVILLTMGDPAGVGPEVCLHALGSAELGAEVIPVVFGEAEVLEACSAQSGLPFSATRLSREDWESGAEPDGPSVVSFGEIGLAEFSPGAVSAATGRAGFAYVEKSIEAAMAGRAAGVTTGPLNKSALHMAGIEVPGHTELFAERTGSTRWCMMQYAEEITCTFVTVHVGYRDVPALLSVERILDVIELTADGLRHLRGREPKMVVCGLNPHAGEGGLFGDREEERFVIPAIGLARERGLDVEGPLPPDTAFVPAKRRTTDAFVCLYHDQGHIPLKALAFDSAVNTTLGLPMVRTSVDHGTALDIAWQGKANPGSLFHAVRLAARLAGLKASGTRSGGPD